MGKTNLYKVSLKWTKEPERETSIIKCLFPENNKAASWEIEPGAINGLITNPTPYQLLINFFKTTFTSKILIGGDFVSSQNGFLTEFCKKNLKVPEIIFVDTRPAPE